MGKFKITNPNGEVFEITAPDSASEQEIMSYAQKNMPITGATTPQQQDPQSWGDVASQAVDNFIPSAKQFGQDIVEPLMHPIDTVNNLYGIGKGYAEMFTPGIQEDEKKALAVNQFVKDRYGGKQNIMNTLAKDPVGSLADVSMLLTGGGTAGARLSSKLPQVANASKKVAQIGNAIDPLTLASKGIGKAGNVAGKLSKELIGASTGVGSDVLDAAYQAGKSGGDKAKHFADNMRNNVDPLMVLEEARQGLDNMRHTRHRNYKAGSQEWLADKTPLTFDAIDGAFTDLKKSMQTDTPNPHWSVSADTQKTISKIEKVIDEWKADPDLHNAGGFDALKRNIDDLMPNKLDTGQSGRAVTEMRNAVKKIIVDQVPEYADTMADYEKAITLENEIKKTLSIGGNPDTAMRKLQSMMRNNVNTNYGQRMNLGQQLEKHGGVNLMDRVAGQNLNKLLPRGMAGVGFPAVVGASLAMGNPMTLGMLPFQSPRAMGELIHSIGKTAKGGKLVKELLKKYGATPSNIRNTSRGLYQEGRLDNQ